MPLEYKISYQPANHFVVPSTSSAGHAYYAITSDKERRMVALTYDENDASTICLALDILTATMTGDRARLRELMRLVDALKERPQ